MTRQLNDINDMSNTQGLVGKTIHRLHHHHLLSIALSLPEYLQRLPQRLPPS